MCFINPPAGYLAPPRNLQVSTADTGGTIAANATYRWVITAVNKNGETIPSNEVSVTTSGGTATNTITLTWDAVVGADYIRIYVTDLSGPPGTEQLAIHLPGTDTSWLKTNPPGNLNEVHPPTSNTAFITYEDLWSTE